MSEKKEPVRRGPRLDTPLEPGYSRLRRGGGGDTDRFGRFAENFARFMGTAQFLLYMTGFVVVWILWNTLMPARLQFDPYAFIFLTLMLSLQASYAAPLILLAQNRQEVRDRVVNEQDRQANTRAHADMEYLAREVASLRMAVGEVATRDFVRSEMRNLLEELLEEQERRDADDSPAPGLDEPAPDPSGPAGRRDRGDADPGSAPN